MGSGPAEREHGVMSAVALPLATGFRARAARPAFSPAAYPAHDGELLLVVNANASGVRRNPDLVSRAAFALRAAGGQVDLRVTESAAELAAVAADPDRRLVLLGGDGTMHALANLPSVQAEAALLPVGGANNIANSLGIPTDLKAAAELAVTGRARHVDAIEARSAHRRVVVVEGVSVGFHALARARYTAVNSTDVRAAVGAGFSAIRAFHPVPVALELDGEAELSPLGQLFAANLPLYGPRLAVAPDADPSDGLIDVVRLETRGRLDTLAALASLRRGRDPKGIERRRARRIRIVTGGRSPVIADTLDLGTGPVDLTIRPEALRIVAPRP
jgi:diacylglycerol kinase (ATP)